MHVVVIRASYCAASDLCAKSAHLVVTTTLTSVRDADGEERVLMDIKLG